MYVLFESWSILAWVLFDNYRWCFYVSVFLLLNHIVSTLFKEWTVNAYKLPKPTFYIVSLIGLFVFLFGTVIYFIYECAVLLYISIYTAVILTTVTHTFRFLHYVTSLTRVEEDKKGHRRRGRGGGEESVPDLCV